MSGLLHQPAVWPHLALNPEPRQTAADPESPERLFAEWFVPQTWPDPPCFSLDAELVPKSAIGHICPLLAATMPTIGAPE